MGSDGPGQEKITSRPVLPPGPPVFGRWRHALRVAGLVAGAGAVVVAAPPLRPADGPPPLPLTVTAMLSRSGEVGWPETGQLLALEDVTAGPEGSARGSTEIWSQTWKPVELALRNIGPTTAFEDQVHVLIEVDGDVLYNGPIAELRTSESATARLGAGQTAQVDLTVSLPTDGPHVFEGHSTDLDLQIISDPVEE